MSIVTVDRFQRPDAAFFGIKDCLLVYEQRFGSMMLYVTVELLADAVAGKKDSIQHIQF